MPFMCVSCRAPRTCCLTCGEGGGGGTGCRHLGTGCVHCVAHLYMKHLLCVKHHMVSTLWNGGGDDGAFADCWISVRKLGYRGTLFSILSTWLCILAPEQADKQTHGVSLQLGHCIVLRNLAQSSLPQLPRKPGGLAVSGACLLRDRLLGLSVVASSGILSGMMPAEENTPFVLCANLTLMWGVLNWEEQLHT